MKIIHNKLIRDNIPQIIEADHKTCKTRILNDTEYLEALKTKLSEEALEVKQAQDKLELTKEIADVLEVLEAISTASGITKEEILAIKEKKAIKNGKFEKKLFLEYVLKED